MKGFPFTAGNAQGMALSGMGNLDLVTGNTFYMAQVYQVAMVALTKKRAIQPLFHRAQRRVLDVVPTDGMENGLVPGHLAV